MRSGASHFALRAWLAPLAAMALAACGGAHDASAHEYWLAPSRYRAARGDTVEVRAWVGTGFRGEAKTYAASRARRLTLRGPRDLDLVPLARNGAAWFARVGLEDGGGALVAYQSDFAAIELGADEFDAYLRLEGLDAPLAARMRARPAADSVRERYARCPKTWVAGGDRRRVTTPAGLRLEIVPLTDPATVREVRARVLFEGRPLAGALVRAFRQPLAVSGAPTDPASRDSLPPVAEVRSGADGTVSVTADEAGEWMLACVHMVPCPDPAVADWESWWASLTFARERGGRAPRR